MGSMMNGEESKIQMKHKIKTEEDGNLCSAIYSSSTGSSTMSIWKSYLSDATGGFRSIYWASKNKFDHTQAFQDFNLRLLYYLTPQRLQTTIKSIPRNQQMEKVGQILDIAYKRYNYLKEKENGKVFPDNYKEPRKVSVLIMGGSVTYGVMCSNFNPVGGTSTIHLENCAWPNRLINFINHFFPGVVEGYPLAYGGINTLIGTEVWKYRMIPDDSESPQNPDILINAFSTNDMHVQTIEESKKLNLTMEDMVHTMHEDFIREVLKPRSSCGERESPLLLYLDDYLGNEQRGVRETMVSYSALSRLSSYYGFAFISYADAVRDFVYGDTSEWWFSSALWPNRQIHPGMGAHISIMYTIAYNILNMVTNYCDRLDIGPEHIYDAIRAGMNELKKSDKLDGEPMPKITNALPPEMTADLTLDEISEKWRLAENASTALAFNSSQCGNTIVSHERPCALSWVFHILEKLQRSIFDTIGEHITLNDGWEEVDPATKEKKGLVPSKLDANLQMSFKNLTIPVEKLNLMVMQSYGEKWARSKIEVSATVFRNGKQAAKQSMNMKGFHAKNTSETFNYRMDLGENKALLGDDLLVEITLTEGKTFKIMGMAFCRF